MSVLLAALLPILLLHGIWARRHSELLRFQLLIDIVLIAAVGLAWLPGVDLNPVRCLQSAPPYDEYEWAAVTALQPAQGDVTLQMHPWWNEARQRLARGELPWLSERIGAGAPLLANGQVGLLAPQMLPVWLLGPESGTTVMAVWKLELAGLGMFLLLRRVWRLRWVAAAVGGVVAAGGPFMVGWLLVPLGWNLAALPWLTWLLHRATSRRASRWLQAGAVAACTGLVATGLHPESALVITGGAVLTALICRPTGAHRLAGVLVIAAAVTVAVTLPSLAAISASSKAQAYAAANPNEDPIPAPLRWAVAAQGVLPAAHGHPGLGAWSAPYPYPAGAVGIGCAALVLAGAARPRRRHWRLVAAAAACLLVPGILLFRLGPLGDLLVHVPPLDRMTLPRFAALIPWALALLAALSVDALERTPVRRWYASWGILAGCGLLAAIELPPPAADRMLVGVSVLAAAAAAVLVQLRSVRALPTLVAVELAVLAVGINPPAAHRDRVPDLPVLHRLVDRAERRPGRVAGVEGALRANVAGRYGLEDLRAFDPVRPLPLARLHAVLGADDPVLPGPLRHAPPRLLGAWSVRYLLAPIGWAAPSGWQPVDIGSGVQVLSNAFWQPEVRVVGRAARRTDAELIAELARDPGWLARAAAVPPGAVQEIAASRVELELAAEPTAHRVAAQVTCDGPCLLVAARSWTPGWSATVDGRSVELVRANLAGLGVRVPPGQHQVELVYHPYGGALRWFLTPQPARSLLLSTERWMPPA